MKKLLASTILTASIFGFAGSASAAEDCGTMTISAMNWASAEVLASIDEFILDKGYGCDASLVPGDTMPTFASMTEKGQPDVAPEMWVNQFRDQIDAAVKDGRVVYGAESLTDGGEEGWWIPTYFAEAHPEIKTIQDAMDHPELFPSSEDPSKGAVYNCPSGWGCQITTTQFFKAYEGEKKGFVLVDTGSGAGLDGSIAKAYENKQPWLGYYWAPTAVLGKYDMTKLGFDTTFDEAEWKRCTSVADCPDPKINAWTKSEVFTMVTPKVAESSSGAAEYLKTRGWSNDIVNKLLAWKEDKQANGEDTAMHFLESQPDVWTKWVPADVAEKVKAAL
ncbi:ABC transporter substrate-binding protein [Aureimonas glaciei]|jgi:glycine betaine/proline transport system substrate-binding protein|uniref:ABC transporter substrate-binding protein n=1 Tax=Aureimonas glaciei TaxID=1776957 RepID=A0A917DA43_9HYPH|nr:ABC transporter substrate-binding protein [Aureimonas glaciei]GGD16466.1 ABC transporter substrate-binding protein [Aureimonas glaciei]